MDDLLRSVDAAALSDTPERRELGVAAQGLASAAKLLTNQYTLIITNVPYLGRSNQVKPLKAYLGDNYKLGKSDLATAFLLRCLEFCEQRGTVALVSPQNWLFLGSYRKLREKLLGTRTWNLVAKLGTGAFETISGAVVNVALLAISAIVPDEEQTFAGIDVAHGEGRAPDKARGLSGSSGVVLVPQSEQLQNPDSRILLSSLGAAPRLGDCAIVSEGLHTGDYPRFGRKHWELPRISDGWERQQGGTGEGEGLGGCEHILFWQQGDGELVDFVRHRLDSDVVSMWIKGEEVWGRRGIAVGTMSDLKHSVYEGVLFTHGIVAIIAKDEADSAAVLAYIESQEFRRDVRLLDQKVAVARAAFESVPFEISRWREVAGRQYPDGLPQPESDDPTQWLFHGRPESASMPIHVAIARILGYRWPAEVDASINLSERARGLIHRCGELSRFAVKEGIVCIPSVRGEKPAADRLLALLSASGVKADRDPR